MVDSYIIKTSVFLSTYITIDKTILRQRTKCARDYE